MERKNQTFYSSRKRKNYEKGTYRTKNDGRRIIRIGRGRFWRGAWAIASWKKEKIVEKITEQRIKKEWNVNQSTSSKPTTQWKSGIWRIRPWGNIWWWCRFGWTGLWISRRGSAKGKDPKIYKLYTKTVRIKFRVDLWT